MNNDEIIAALRSEKKRRTPVDLAEMLNTFKDGGLSQSMLIVSFAKAFPAIPLGVLLRAAGEWKRTTGGPIDDDEFNEILRPWL